MFGVGYFDIVITNPPYIGQKQQSYFEPVKNLRWVDFISVEWTIFISSFIEQLIWFVPKV